ncbi:acyl-CoA dehydrogenase family protein [Streptomyces sp. NPDC056227]|uniref:acyl-CoA dehydrogenase family protein n=1 Tax=Streptomyces sp. NPDC056227 TaxID=3345753 RepID=UPI0035D84379
MSRPTFGLDADYLELRAVVREVAEDRIAPHAAEVDDRSAFPEQSLKALVAARLHTLTIPAAYGGEGVDHLVAVVAAEEVARVCATTQQVAGSNELFVLPLPTGTITTDTGRTDPGSSYAQRDRAARNRARPRRPKPAPHQGPRRHHQRVSIRHVTCNDDFSSPKGWATDDPRGTRCPRYQGCTFHGVGDSEAARHRACSRT